ncbi:unnamed protein product [Pedinophyceae sp. YPF-701]|nr:unnamed protein product [Pedinophyceae sp. YPF-701]
MGDAEDAGGARSVEYLRSLLPPGVEGPEITNVVAQIKLNAPLDLEELHRRLNNAVYQPLTGFNGVIVRPQRPKVTFTVQHNGRIQHAGWSGTDARQVLWAFAKKVKGKLGISEEVRAAYRVVNVVAKASVGFPVDLDALVRSTGNLGVCKYDPERMSGAAYHMESPKATLRIWRSGAVKIMGAKSELGAWEAFCRIYVVLCPCRMARGDAGEGARGGAAETSAEVSAEMSASDSDAAEE